MITEKETNLVSSTITLAFELGTLSRVQCRGGEPKSNSSGLAQWGRQGREFEATELAGICEAGHRKKEALQRRLSINLHLETPLALWPNTKLPKCQVQAQEAQQKTTARE